MESDALGGIGNVFGPDMWSKLATNPKLSKYLANPDTINKLQEIQKNPKSVGQYMQDPAIMQIMLGLMGLDGGVATNPEEMEQMKAEGFENIEKKRAEEAHAQQTKAPETVDVGMTPEEAEMKSKRENSDELKNKGTACYKKRQFEEALKHYDEAYEADNENIAVLTNKSAVLFEMEKYEECIAVSEKAVEEGRSLRVDFKLIARAFGRMGSSYVKMNDFDNAIKYFEKSLAENRTADILEKLRDTEAAKKKRDIEAYISPELSDKAREEGNELFKVQNYAESVKFYAEAIKRNPSDPRNYSNRAASLTKLMALPEAEKDCDKAIELDANFIKAYIRKAAIQFTKKEYAKCIETCNLAQDKDTEQKHAGELQGQVNVTYIDPEGIYGNEPGPAR
jgi:stress-induced-phosphoprotein 1